MDCKLLNGLHSVNLKLDWNCYLHLNKAPCKVICTAKDVVLSIAQNTSWKQLNNKQFHIVCIGVSTPPQKPPLLAKPPLNVTFLVNAQNVKVFILSPI